MPPPMKNITPEPAWSPTWIFRGLVLVIALWAFFSCFTPVPADSVGVLTRFGRYTATVNPGLRFMLPLGIEKIQSVPVQRQLKLEFGFTTPGASNRDQRDPEPEETSSMVTGDLNMAQVEWVVQYRVEDAKAFLFHVREPGQTLRDASESIMREVVGDRTVDEVLTVGRQDVESDALVRLNAISKRYNLGLGIMQVQLKNVHPPQAVQASFNEVNQAQQEKQQMINVANGEYNKIVPRTRGEAEQKILAAQGYAVKRVNEARGDAERFNAQLVEYNKAPEVTRERLYLEMMNETLPTIDHKIILDEKARGLLPLLPLNLSRTEAVK